MKRIEYMKRKNFSKIEIYKKQNQIDILELINAISEIKNSLNEMLPYQLVNTYWPKPPEFLILHLHGYLALPGPSWSSP